MDVIVLIERPREYGDGTVNRVGGAEGDDKVTERRRGRRADEDQASPVGQDVGGFCVSLSGFGKMGV